MITEVLLEDVLARIARQDFKGVQEIGSQWPPADVAELIGRLSNEDRVLVFRLLPTQRASETFAFLDSDEQSALLQAMGQEKSAQLLELMSPDDRTALLETLPGDVVNAMLRLLGPKERRIAQALLNYPEESVGRLMTPDYLSIRDEWTIQETLDHIRSNGRDSETINVLYVLDERGRLLADVRIRELLLRPVDVHIRDFRGSKFVSLRPESPEEEAFTVFRKYARNTLPVVDEQGFLLGIVTSDDVIEMSVEQTSEDVHKMGGMEYLETPYLETRLGMMLRKRGTWLVVLFLSEMLTATAMAFFQNEISRAVVLTLFLPLIISSGGNSGSQASTLIIRAMALEEIRLRDWWRVMRGEVLTGFALGVLLGVIGFVRIAVWSGFSPSLYGPHWPLVGLTVSVALVGVVMWGTLAGAMLPFLLRRVGLDPATSSAPFVATLVDVTGLVIYFVVAYLILRGTLL